MQRTPRPRSQEFGALDRQRLARARADAADVRSYRRLQAVLLVARGHAIPEVAALTGARPWAIYAWVRRYLRDRRAESLHDAPRTGRPRAAPGLTDARIIRELRRDPLRWGYSTTGWTITLLARHLARQYDCPISARTRRRRLHRRGLRWKRPRYVDATKEPHRAAKKGRLFAA